MDSLDRKWAATWSGEAHLEPMLVGDIAGAFFVPAYQRGYRWGPVEVGRLLEDIWENPDEPYYLQPIVVRPHEDEWELVDGQQRLTTLFLILLYMEREGLQSAGPSFSMRYETRPGSAEYLRSLEPERSQENIDFFHIFDAYRCIAEWFEAHGNRRQHVANRFYGALFDHVRVIWYEAPPDLDPAELFTRLNVGRIPLTDAELVKAMLLSRSRGAPGIADRTAEMAAQWDAIERDLRQPALWAFITGRHHGDATHIGLLLDALAGGPTGRERPLFHTFEELKHRIEEDPKELWDRVVDLHGLIVGWYENRDLFHKIGFLVAVGAATFATLIEQSADKPKSTFEAELDGMIRQHLKLSEADVRSLSYDDRRKTSDTLLLMNVETVRGHAHTTERFSFTNWAGGGWSLEHIHAQNAGPLNTADQWATWLALHRTALATQDGVDENARQTVLARIDTVLDAPPVSGPDFRSLERTIVDLLSDGSNAEEADVDSIANLALLHGHDNSALGNSVFAVKRGEILQRDRDGSYIPACTRNVFLKYYAPADGQQLHLWSEVDRQHYLDAITEALQPYLMPSDGEP